MVRNAEKLLKIKYQIKQINPKQNKQKKHKRNNPRIVFTELFNSSKIEGFPTLPPKKKLMELQPTTWPLGLCACYSPSKKERAATFTGELCYKITVLYPAKVISWAIQTVFIHKSVICIVCKVITLTVNTCVLGEKIKFLVLVLRWASIAVTHSYLWNELSLKINIQMSFSSKVTIKTGAFGGNICKQNQWLILQECFCTILSFPYTWGLLRWLT